MKKTIAITVLLTWSLSAVAGPASPAPPQKPDDAPKLSETVDVHVISVDVVVTDRKGNPIQGLTKDDFEVYENGDRKPITNFSEINARNPVSTAEQQPVAAAAPAAPAPVRVEEIPDNQKRRIIFFIDNLSLNPFSRNRVFKEMKNFITNVMRPGDEAMIATFNRSMKTRVPFTRDTAQLQQTLDIIAGESGLGVGAASDLRDTESHIEDAQSFDDAMSTARTYSESVQHDLRTAVESVNALMTTLAGVEGKKILVLTSEGFPMQPGREVFEYLDEQAREKNWPTSSSLESMSYDAHELIRSVADTANANNITLYTIHAAGLTGAETNSAENRKPVSYNVAQAGISNTTESMQLMAELTGGTASVQTNNFANAFNHIKSDLDSYYSLGYRAGTERIDRQRRLEVRTKNRSYVVRNRQSFVEKSIYAEMNDRVVANLLYTSKQNDLNILVHTGQPRAADDDLFRVPVEVQIPMTSLTLLPQGEIYAGGFDVYVVVGNKDGDMSDVARKTNQIHVPVADMPTLKGKYYTYSMELLMERGLNKISVGVVDSVSNQTGFFKDQVIAQDLR